MLRLSDRVKETSSTSGSGLYVSLGGSFRGFQTFSDGIGDNNTTFYTIENAQNYEVGIGTYNSSNNTLSRDLVLESSNSDQRINLVDTSIVFCTYPAYHSVFLNEKGYVSGLMPYYSGIAFPDGTIQTEAININGSGVENNLAYWSSSRILTNIDNISWDDSNDLISISGDMLIDGNLSISNDLISSGDFVNEGDTLIGGDLTVSGVITSSSGVFISPTTNDLTFVRDSAGCFFHAYVDNSYDNMIALFSSNEANPYWKLGIKSYTTDFTTEPTLGYIQAENGFAGVYATSQNYTSISYVNGFWVRHENVDLFNIQRDEGTRVLNSISTVTAFTVKGASAQSANLQEWQDYSGDTVASMNIDGQLSIDSIKFSDNTIQTTAYSTNFKTIVSSTSLLASDNIVFADCSTNSINITLPTASGLGGKKIVIKRKPIGTNSLNILPYGSEEIDGTTVFSMPYANQSITLVSDNNDWFVI